ncbi:MAG TPA: hypothetical protein VGY97_10010 [Solirubrobacteraceae bacterium]|nr:hypothetical protein [Solirubrobacteraceae bacterium]
MFKRDPYSRPRTPGDAELTAYADGSLPPERERIIAEQVAASPELQAIVAEQVAAIGLIRGVTTAAPPSVHQSLEPRPVAVARPSRRFPVAVARPSRRFPVVVARPHWRFQVAAVAGTATAVVAAVVLIGGGAASQPTVAQAAVFGEGPATMPPPAQDRSRPAFLRQAVQGVAYPTWSEFHLAAVGQRRDPLAGRQAVTVFYANRSDAQIGYTIVSGRPLTVTGPARTVVRGGVTYQALATGTRAVVTWQRGGHTCILSSSRAGASQLIQLASADGHDWTSYNAAAGAEYSEA